MHPSQQHQPHQQQWSPPPPPGWGPPPPPRKNRGVRVALALGGVLVALIVLVIAIAPDRPAGRKSAKASASPSSTAEIVPVSEVPRPTAKQARLLRSELGLIDPGLNHERSIGRARNSCWDLLNGMDRTEVANRTQQRFDGGSASVDIIDADQILGVIEATFCHH